MKISVFVRPCGFTDGNEKHLELDVGGGGELTRDEVLDKVSSLGALPRELIHLFYGDLEITTDSELRAKLNKGHSGGNGQKHPELLHKLIVSLDESGGPVDGSGNTFRDMGRNEGRKSHGDRGDKAAT